LAPLRFLLLAASILVLAPVLAAADAVDETDVVARIARFDGSVFVRGDAGLRRAATDLPLFAGDAVATREGAATIVFLDDSEVEMEALSRFVIGEDAAPRTAGRVSGTFALGTARFRSGNLAREGYRLETPVGVIGIRGTYFEVSVDGLGVSLIRLLEDLDGSVGEIVVATEVGSVTLDRAGEATRIDAPTRLPSAPSILDLSPGATSSGTVSGEAGGADAEAVADAVDPLDGAVRALDRDFLETRLLDDDPLAIDDGLGDALADDPLSDTASGVDGSGVELAVTSETDPDGVPVEVLTRTSSTGDAIRVATPAASGATVVVDPAAQVEQIISRSAGGNVIIVRPSAP
jgi:opacity protein-like surface antigen